MTTARSATSKEGHPRIPKTGECRNKGTKALADFSDVELEERDRAGSVATLEQPFGTHDRDHLGPPVVLGEVDYAPNKNLLPTTKPPVFTETDTAEERALAAEARKAVGEANAASGDRKSVV